MSPFCATPRLCTWLVLGGVALSLSCADGEVGGSAPLQNTATTSKADASTPRLADAGDASGADAGAVTVDSAPVVLRSCDPARALGTVHLYASALLEIIAFAEGTADYGANDGYDVMFTFRVANGCTEHPNKVNCSGSLCSTAAGRYQFLYKTWTPMGYPDFEPNHQALGAMALVKQRSVSLPSTRALTATEFKTVLDKISYEWASLPPGRYGQPVRTSSELRALYCSQVSCT